MQTDDCVSSFTALHVFVGSNFQPHNSGLNVEKGLFAKSVLRITLFKMNTENFVIILKRTTTIINALTTTTTEETLKFKKLVF